MINKLLKPFVPHVIAVVIFIVLASTYFYPQLEGLRLRQGDIEQAVGMSKEISDFREKYGTDPLWTNSTFGGMPAYQISTKQSNYITNGGDWLLGHTLSRPIGYIVVAMIAFYILLLCFEVSPWLSIIGAIAFGLASFNMLYLSAGHNSKVYAVALLPAVFGGLLLAYRKNYIMGALLFSFFLCLHIGANHPQMTYYALFLIAFTIIAEFIIHFQNKTILKFIKVSIVILFAAILGILPSFSKLYTTYEYSKYSTRGKSELTISPSQGENETQTPEDALDASYITQHSLGFGEVWSLVIPNVKGGTPNYIGNIKGATKNIDPQYEKFVAQSNAYWGEQYVTGGAFYFGATMFVLFILGFVFIKDPIKWAFLAATALAVVLSWKYGSITEYFIYHFPLFKKFRDTKMILTLVQIAFPFIGLLFIKEIFAVPINRKKLMYTLLVINGLLFLFYSMPRTFFDFLSLSDSENFSKQIAAYQSNPEYQNQLNAAFAELENARIVIFKKDVLRSLFFALAISGLVYTFVLGKIKRNYLLIGIGVLVLLDLWAVDKRYMNNAKSGSGYKMWVNKQKYANPHRPSAADNFILSNELSMDSSLRVKIDENVTKSLNDKKEKGQDIEVEKEKLTFRELNFATDYRVVILPDPFSDASVSYFHKSLGGYSGAKLKKYQELIEFYISKELNSMVSTFNDSTVTMGKLLEEFKNTPVLNMLNTRYVIYNPNAAPLINAEANGNCWFVNDIKIADNANDEMLSLGKVNLKATAVVNKKYKGDIQPFSYDSTAIIKETLCLPNHLTYTSSSSTPQVAVFSEIYYPKGWNAYVDGKKSTYFSADYLLRAMYVPAGKHTIEFRFEPQSYYLGEKVSMASSILLIVLLIGALGFEAYKKTKV